MDTSNGTDVPVALVDGHGLFRSMMRTGLSAQDGIRVAISVGSAAEARRAILPGSATVAIVDAALSDGDGVSLGVELRRRDPRLRILLLNAQKATNTLSGMSPEALQNWSYLSSTSTMNLTSLARAVRATAKGESVRDPTVTMTRSYTALAHLTRRQYEVLEQVSLGLSNQLVAARFGIAERSVHNHLTGIYATLGIDHNVGMNPRVSAVLQFLAEAESAFPGVGDTRGRDRQKHLP